MDGWTSDFELAKVGCIMKSLRWCAGWCLVVLMSPLSWAQSGAYRNEFGKLPASPTHGDRLLLTQLHAVAKELEQHAPAPASKEKWETERSSRHRELREMLSLDPMPDKTDLCAEITGREEHADFIVEKLHFQSRPGLYATANVYVPKGLTGPAPAILYVCGHGAVKIEGVSYGNKVTYQHHGAWFARNGYVCLVLDSIQLGEIEGIHHGTYREGMWWWNSRGYSSAGGEAWNCIRAIDYLQTRNDVDGERIGVTGRSGGGAYSFWVAALDERIRVACPVAGITDLRNHVVDGCVEGHCDCMFPVNTYRWDFHQIAALIAPRPMLICNTDKDPIFPLDGVVRLHAKVRDYYDLYGAHDRFGLVITEGAHKDSQDLQVPVMRWFHQWLKQEKTPVVNVAEAYFTPQQLKVFASLPKDEITSRCYEGFTQVARHDRPQNAETAREQLRNKTFGGWPSNPTRQGGGTVLTRQEIVREGIRFAVIEFESEPGLPLRLYVGSPSESPATSIAFRVGTHTEWEAHLAAWRPRFGEILKQELQGRDFDHPTGEAAKANEKLWNAWSQEVKEERQIVAMVTPRGVGMTAMSPEAGFQTQVRRRYMLLGRTLAGMQVWDALQGASQVRSMPEATNLPLQLSADHDMTELACYLALFLPDVERLRLHCEPREDVESPDFLNASRIVTPPQLLELVRIQTQVVIESQDQENGQEKDLDQKKPQSP